MAAVIGALTEDRSGPRRIVLRGTAQLLPGDDTLSIDFPPGAQAALGRELLSKWTVRLESFGEPIILEIFSWNALTQDQWNEMAQTQWNEMTQ